MSTTTVTTTGQTASPGQIDVRGPRFRAAVTCVVLALALVLGPQLGSGWWRCRRSCSWPGGAGRQPPALRVLFRALVRPRLAPATEFEDVRPPRFAQAVGLVFAVVALVGAAAGLPVLYYAAVGMALAAAFLNAAFNFCLGCEFYLLIARARGRASRGLTPPGCAAGGGRGQHADRLGMPR